MISTARTNIPRLIRVGTLLLTVTSGALVYFGYETRTENLQYRLDDAERELRSDEIAASEMPHLRAERAALAARYARLLEENPEAVFLRELLDIARTHHVTLVTTSLTPADPGHREGAAKELFSPTHGTVELRGAYRDLLVALSTLSTGSEIVAVDPPSLRRDGSVVIASIPVTIYEPARPSPQTP